MLLISSKMYKNNTILMLSTFFKTNGIQFQHTSQISIRVFNSITEELVNGKVCNFVCVHVKGW